jgi:phosphoenolpyruvate synthase/pyruvate phosphate dikinase
MKQSIKKTNKWKSVGMRKNNSVLNRDIYIEAFSKKYIQAMTGIDHGCRNLLFVDSTLYINEKEFKEFADIVVVRALDESGYYKEIIAKFASACTNIEQYSYELMKESFADKSIEILKEDFRKAIDKFLVLVSFSYLNHNEEEIPKRLRAAIDPEATIALPNKKTLLQQEKDVLHTLAKEIDVNNLTHESKKRMKEHIAQYPWVKSKYFSVEEVSFEETIERMKKLVAVEQKEYENDTNNEKHIIVGLLEEQLYHKTLRKELISLFSYAVKDLFAAIAKKQGLTHQEFIAQTFDEIQEFFDTGITNKEEIQERVHDFTYFFIEGKKLVISKSERIKEKQKSQKLRGLVGSEGIITARVRVIKDNKEIHALQNDEILVIESISPDLTLHITKVQGIITDSGGILSHAVLVAKECAVPCIVGTKHATATLKTGDFVLLDASQNSIEKIDPIKHFPKKKFREIGTITMGLCRADLYMPTHVFNTADVLGEGHDDIMFHIKDGKTTLYFTEEAIKKMGACGLKLLQSKEFVKKNRKEVQEMGEELWAHVDNVAALPIKHIPTKELLEHYNSLFIAIQKTFGYFNVSQPSISFAIEDEIAKHMMQMKFSANAQFEIIETMLKQEETTLIEEEERDLLKIGLLMKNLGEGHDDVRSALAVHMDKYAFLAASENFDEFDLQYYKRRLETIQKKSIQVIHKEIARLHPDKELLEQEREKIVQKYGLSSELVHFLDVARIYSHQRMLVRIFWTKGVHLWGEILREFARKMNISEVDIQYITREEINNYFTHNIKINKEEIDKRKEPSIFTIFDRKRPLLFTGKDAENMYQHFLFEEVLNKNMVKGVPASKGIKQGKVKLLSYGENMVKQIQEMEYGDILVTGNTRPDMILALKKAAAVVTDEGGICSHAALVSREFGIPCIVGTKDATKIFKDGDVIEVDANTGVVKRVIENKKNKKKNYCSIS